MEFATLHLDIYKVVKLLQEKGYSEKAAEGFIQAIQEITLTGVATKQDLQDLGAKLKGDIQNVRSEIQDVREQVVHLKNETLKFLIIQTLTIIGVMVALFQFFSVVL
jgi:hypothetical protein